MVLMMNRKTDFAHIFAAITNISVVDRYSTLTRPLHADDPTPTAKPLFTFTAAAF